MNRLKISESQEQATLFEWATLNIKKYPELWLLHHIPNGGSRNKIEATNLKRQGVKSGVPDICLPVARRGYHGFYIELKSMTGRISDNQAEWVNKLKEQNYFAVIAYGFEESKSFIEWYLKGEIEVAEAVSTEASI